MQSDDEYEIERELRRVVDRLTSMPLDRAATASVDCHQTAEILLAQTRLLTDDIPADARIPELGPSGLGAMIAVLGRDYLRAARAADVTDLTPALDALVALRRALP